MKTKILFITGMLIASFIMSPIISKAEPSQFSKLLSKSIKYPSKASENQVEGTLWFSIDVDENGVMTVNESNHSCCEYLHKEVVKQLDGQKMKGFNESMIGNHKVKMVFQIEK